MKLNFKTKNLIVCIVVAAILGAGAWFYFNDFQHTLPESGTEKPQVIKPQTGYPEGTSIDLYQDAPPGFPKKIILENRPLAHSTIVELPDGKKQYAVSYFSSNDWQTVAKMYEQSLPKNEWKIDNAIYNQATNTAVISASWNDKKIILTASQVQSNSGKTLVSLQYQETKK